MKLPAVSVPESRSRVIHLEKIAIRIGIGSWISCVVDARW